MKLKTKIKTLALDLSFLFVLSILLDAGILKAFWYAEQKAEDLFPAYSSYGVSLTKEAIADELPMKQWIEREFKLNGLNPDVADCVIFGESGYDINRINSKSVDLGIMQWNAQHVKSGLISLECTGNYKCAVTKAIEKIKIDGDWKAWMAYDNNNCSKFGKTFIK